MENQSSSIESMQCRYLRKEAYKTWDSWESKDSIVSRKFGDNHSNETQNLGRLLFSISCGNMSHSGAEVHLSIFPFFLSSTSFFCSKFSVTQHHPSLAFWSWAQSTYITAVILSVVATESSQWPACSHSFPQTASICWMVFWNNVPYFLKGQQCRG